MPKGDDESCGGNGGEQTADIPLFNNMEVKAEVRLPRLVSKRGRADHF
jgi:hypothetical protein